MTVTLTPAFLSLPDEAEQNESFTVTVSGDGGTPTGNFRITAATGTSATPICDSSLVNGTGSCRLQINNEFIGAVSFTADYLGTQPS